MPSRQPNYLDFDTSDEEDFGNSPEKPARKSVGKATVAVGRYRVEDQQPRQSQANDFSRGSNTYDRRNPPNAGGPSRFPSDYPPSPVVINTYVQPGMAPHNAWLQHDPSYHQGRRDGGPPPQPPPELSRTNVQNGLRNPAELLKETQLKLAAKDAEILRLTQLVAQSNISDENRIDPAAPAGKTKGGKSAATERNFDDRKASICEAARKFTIMHEPFPQETCFTRPDPKVSVSEPLEYTDIEAMEDFYISQLYRFNPKRLHRDLETSTEFRKIYTTQSNNIRRNTMFKIRRVLAKEIWPDEEPGLYESDSHMERSRSDVFLKRIRNPDFGKDKGEDEEEEEEVNLLKAPILYPNSKMRPEDLFKTRELGLLLRGILFGANSVLNPKAKPAHGTLGRNWGIKCLTPGLVAFGGVIIVFLHSMDKTLNPVGHETNVCWSEGFDKLKMTLLEMLQGNSGNAVMQFLNRIVFTGVNWNHDSDKSVPKLRRIRLTPDSPQQVPARRQATQKRYSKNQGGTAMAVQEDDADQDLRFSEDELEADSVPAPRQKRGPAVAATRDGNPTGNNAHPIYTQAAGNSEKGKRPLRQDVNSNAALHHHQRTLVFNREDENTHSAEYENLDFSPVRPARPVAGHDPAPHFDRSQAGNGDGDHVAGQDDQHDRMDYPAAQPAPRHAAPSSENFQQPPQPAFCHTAPLFESSQQPSQSAPRDPASPLLENGQQPAPRCTAPPAENFQQPAQPALRHPAPPQLAFNSETHRQLARHTAPPSENFQQPAQSAFRHAAPLLESFQQPSQSAPRDPAPPLSENNQQPTTPCRSAPLQQQPNHYQPEVTGGNDEGHEGQVLSGHRGLSSGHLPLGCHDYQPISTSGSVNNLNQTQAHDTNRPPHRKTVRFADCIIAEPHTGGNISGTQGLSNPQTPIRWKPANQFGEDRPVQVGRKKAIPAESPGPEPASGEGQPSNNAECANQGSPSNQSPVKLTIMLPPTPTKGQRRTGKAAQGKAAQSKAAQSKAAQGKAAQDKVAEDGVDAGEGHQPKVARRSTRQKG